MAQLVYEIKGDNISLANAVNDSIAKIQLLQKSINDLNKGAQSNGLGNAIAQANSQALNFKKTIDDTNLSLKDKSGLAALDQLGQKLLVIRGNADLFGQTLKNQQSELGAYQSALNRLLSAGFDPLDGDVLKLKADIDSLTASMAAQNALSVRRTIVSDSRAEVAQSLTEQHVGPVASSGSSALIAAFNKDLAAGKITVAEYNAAIATAAQNQARFAASTASTIPQLTREEGLLEGLNAELILLKQQKFTIANTGDLARQNVLIAETEAQIAALNNVGKAGFDKFGNAIKDGTSAVGGFGKGLTGAYGTLRQLAYILPGIGIAGIFNLAFEGISKATESLGLFNSKLTVAQSNLNNLNSVVQSASKQFGDQSTNLRVLYTATQDVANSEHNRLLAAQELQKEFPSLFGNIKTETILNGGAADAYNTATTAILENAKAKAAASKISELAGKQLQADFQILKIQNAQVNELARVPSLVVARAANNPNVDAVAVPRSVLIQQANDAINERAKTSIKLENQNKKDLQAQIDFLTQFAGGNNKIAAALSSGNKVKTALTGAGENAFDSLNKQLDEIFRKTQASFDQSGLQGYALEVQKINDKYKEQDTQIQSILNKQQSLFNKGKISPAQLSKATGKAQNDFDITDEARQKELGDAAIKEATRVSNEIQRIRDEFGVRSEQSRSKELASIQLRYDKEVKLAQGNQDILAAAAEGRLTAFKAINEKYVQLEQDLWNKLGTIDDQAQAEIGDRTSVETGRIIKEWEQRRQAAKQYYDELVRIGKSDISSVIAGFNVPGLIANAARRKTNTGINNAENADINIAQNRNLLSGLQSATSGFISDFITGMESANQTIGADFASVFSGIASSFQKTMTNVITNVIGRLLTEKLEDAIKQGLTLSKGLQAGIAAAGIGGALISGLSPKTSVIGQGLGGALSGAASGAAIGSLFGPAGTLVGGVAGGAIGLLGGIFGASKAQKELQAQQLEQAKQQTAALKASLAYTATVIGRMTQSGLITGVDVNATGQLVATVNGKDLQFVLDRNKR